MLRTVLVVSSDRKGSMNADERSDNPSCRRISSPSGNVPGVGVLLDVRLDVAAAVTEAVSSDRRESDSDELLPPSSHELRWGPVIEACAGAVVEFLGHL
ncbi:hypothetical protein, partial [Nocardioides immobilis]|uniref:hypothetical protein n=1 Tax=Nocardioides immobilis TaxID=2049295 RepID=UPI001C70D8C1